MITLTGFLEKCLKTREGEDLIELSAKLPQLSAKAFEAENGRANSELQARVREMSVDEIREMLRLTTIFFHLVNSLEQYEIIRINRQRAERSEEHTSELQSRGHLVCRLLLEKKKN